MIINAGGKHLYRSTAFTYTQTEEEKLLSGARNHYLNSAGTTQSLQTYTKTL